jgi:ATP-dependent Clp protease, protease subunit
MRHKIKGDLTSWNSSVWEFGQLMKTVGEDEEITLEVNSYGGDVFIGIDLCNTLRAHKGKVTAVVTGIAASAASILLMGADVIQAYSNTQIMVHNAWTIVAGNAKELRKAADDLDSIGESVLASYTGRLDADQAKKLLDDETFLSAQKAKEIGLVDEIVDGQEVEEVYSELFQDEAREFNDSLKDRKIAASLQTQQADLEQQLRGLIDLLKNAVQAPPAPKEPDPAGAPPQPKTAALKNIFINLK